jgi:serine/threonine-protein kinase
VVTYFLITGYFPFTGVNDLVLMNQHLTMRPRPPSDVNPMLPTALDPVLATALAKRIENRFNTATEFTTALRRVLNGTADFTVRLRAMEENPARLIPEHDPNQQQQAFYPLPAPAPEKRE